MTAKLITANHLADGLVVFLTADGGWSYRLADARVISDAELEAALRHAKAQHEALIVVDPYEIEATVEDGVPVPVRLRERIRAAGGPTVTYGEAELAERAALLNQAG
ncbi:MULTISPECIES: DUF2849 domain-containing protein [Kaistia]|uniref:DUF2849 domain-containing protein n=1 Tax=Kaistia nematophila TaxID=2994654 RepID=A0A9X3IN70_9HYPH|nr:DUF2849 domain-containing protein [Kaistia nematophila]MBN9058468.1 DUF2849 domain-containing protein [Hyphomicrobiales bacterium]MCX5571667.1 DUF2849 domain-containing protein [Kaistia nematophila]